MNRLRILAYAAFALAALPAAAFAADDSVQPGRKIFGRDCAGCHEAASPGGPSLGPSLVGIVGRQAGTGASGVHSRAAIESGIVWTRSALRRYLSAPESAMPGTLMPGQVSDPKELEALLDYLETLR